jgi:hypothetical protein
MQRRYVMIVNDIIANMRAAKVKLLRSRTFRASVYGVTAPVMEYGALTQARKFFGPDVRLVVVPNYCIKPTGALDPSLKFQADITIREIG